MDASFSNVKLTRGGEGKDPEITPEKHRFRFGYQGERIQGQERINRSNLSGTK